MGFRGNQPAADISAAPTPEKGGTTGESEGAGRLKLAGVVNGLVKRATLGQMGGVKKKKLR